MASAAERILRYLKDGNELTEAQARRKFGIKNVSARISDIRYDLGYAVYNNERRGRNGRTYRSYRLGTPTRQVVAAGQAAIRPSRTIVLGTGLQF